MSEAVERAVQAALPDRTVASMDGQVARPGNEIAYVTFEDADPLYVKTATDTTERLVRETAATRYAAAHSGVGAPTVVRADPDGDPPYLVTEPMPGTPVNEPWTGDGDREALLRQTGRTVAAVHEASFDEPGVIVGGDADGLALTDTTWTETLCETVEWRKRDWFADRFTDLPDRLVDTIREVGPTLDGGRPTLLHCDCSRINVYLHPNGLIDWERALVGDPAFDLVDATFHHTDQPDVEDEERPKLVNALEEGYRDRAGSLPDGLEHRRPLYRAIAYLLVPQAFDDWAPEAPRPENELAAEVRAEFDERLEAARDAMG